MQAVFTNSDGTATTNPALVTVYGVPLVTQQPPSATVYLGDSQTVTITASSNGTPASVNWQESTDGGHTWGPGRGAFSSVYWGIDDPIAGVAQASLALSTLTLSLSGTEYRATFTNAAGSTTTNPATLTLLSGHGPTATSTQTVWLPLVCTTAGVDGNHTGLAITATLPGSVAPGQTFTVAQESAQLELPASFPEQRFARRRPGLSQPS